MVPGTRHDRQDHSARCGRSVAWDRAQMEEEMATPSPRHPSSLGPAIALTQLLTRAERLLDKRFSAILAEAGYTMDGWRVLCLLADGGGHPMTEVAGQVFLPPASLTKLMDHLVDDNLVYRRVDDLDRRR